MKCKTYGHELKEESDTILIDGWHYEKVTTQKNKTFKELVKPRKDAVLWEQSDFAKFSKEQWIALNLFDDWFWIKQFSKYWEAQGKVARFYANSLGAYLDCGGDPTVRDDGLGVRWKWPAKKFRGNK